MPEDETAGTTSSGLFLLAPLPQSLWKVAWALVQRGGETTSAKCPNVHMGEQQGEE